MLISLPSPTLVDIHLLIYKVTSTAEIERLMGCHKLLDSPLTQARTPSTVSKLISIFKDTPSVDDFDFPLACLVWKYLEAVRSGRQVTAANPLRRFVYFANPAVLPTPGKKCVNAYQDILPARKLRQTRKANIKKKIAKHLDNPEVPVEHLIDALEDEVEPKDPKVPDPVVELLEVMDFNDPLDEMLDI